ncbi:MAG: hypothetical protein A3F16_06480 [Deltaproteobacteria bacterium RIFCSPHIGHO2_12_FULL_43_9]|nr:MAG: hypothetical protein A3F16_06480 [Deltaproteobacteria bacterium RIFCSPHIGHO2_12_FULL_43_9]
MSTAKKITIHIEENLLKKALQSTGEGVTATVRKGLQLVAASLAYKKLLQLRGKYKFSIDLNELRKDKK